LKSRDVVIEFKKDHLKVGLRGWAPVIDGELAGVIYVNDDTTWTLGDNKTVTIQLSKVINFGSLLFTYHLRFSETKRPLLVASRRH
jgi:hypothetical protein